MKKVIGVMLLGVLLTACGTTTTPQQSIKLLNPVGTYSGTLNDVSTRIKVNSVNTAVLTSANGGTLNLICARREGKNVLWCSVIEGAQGLELEGAFTATTWAGVSRITNFATNETYDGTFYLTKQQ